MNPPSSTIAASSIAQQRLQSQLAQVINGARQRFIDHLDAQLLRISEGCHSACGGPDASSREAALDLTRRELHNLIGIAGTLGYPRVSAAAQRLHEQLRGVASHRLSAPPEAAVQSLIAESMQAASTACAGAADLPIRSAPASRTARLLLVDDHRDLLEITRTQLSSAGFEVIAISDSRKALQVLQQQDLDLVVIDWVMPDLDGEALLRQIRGRPRTDALPVVVFTSQGYHASQARMCALGADAVVTKSASIQPLLAELHAQLERRIPR